MILSLDSFSQTKPNEEFKTTNFKTHYFSGKNGKELHTMTIGNDSTFHITVPNNSGGCHTWGEYGGQVQIKDDSITFIFRGLYNEKQIFIIKNNKTIEKITAEGFRYKTYKLKKW